MKYLYPSNLFKNYNELIALVNSGYDMQLEENLKLFENLLNKSLPDWNNENHLTLYKFWNSITDNRTKGGDMHIVGRQYKVYDFLRNTDMECIILWSRSYIIAGWFNLSGVIFVKWLNDRRCYEVTVDRRSKYGNRRSQDNKHYKKRYNKHNKHNNKRTNRFALINNYVPQEGTDLQSVTVIQPEAINELKTEVSVIIDIADEVLNENIIDEITDENVDQTIIELIADNSVASTIELLTNDTKLNIELPNVYKPVAVEELK